MATTTNKETQQQTDAPPTKEEPTEQPATDKTKGKSKVLIIVISILGILVLIMGSVITWFLLTRDKDEDAEDKDKQETEEENEDEDEEDTDSDDQDDSENEDNSSNGEPPDTTPDEPDMTEGWNTYNNSTWNFSLKYPLDMTYDEEILDGSTNEMSILFRVGTTDVFAVWVKNDGPMDTFLNNMIANMCTDTVQYSDVSFDGVSYRKALDVPNQTCLDTFSITRNVDLVAFGRDMTTPGYYFGFRNEGLNDSQLNAVIGSISWD